MTDFVGLFAAITGIVAPISGAAIVLLDRNKKWKEVKVLELETLKAVKIAEAKENSLGETRVVKMENKYNEFEQTMWKRYDEFTTKVYNYLLE
jgi:hypothetical protein